MNRKTRILDVLQDYALQGMVKRKQLSQQEIQRRVNAITYSVAAAVALEVLLGPKDESKAEQLQDKLRAIKTKIELLWFHLSSEEREDMLKEQEELVSELQKTTQDEVRYTVDDYASIHRRIMQKATIEDLARYNGNHAGDAAERMLECIAPSVRDTIGTTDCVREKAAGYISPRLQDLLKSTRPFRLMRIYTNRYAEYFDGHPCSECWHWGLHAHDIGLDFVPEVRMPSRQIRLDTRAQGGRERTVWQRRANSLLLLLDWADVTHDLELLTKYWAGEITQQHLKALQQPKIRIAYRDAEAKLLRQFVSDEQATLLLEVLTRIVHVASYEAASRGDK